MCSSSYVRKWNVCNVKERGDEEVTHRGRVLVMCSDKLDIWETEWQTGNPEVQKSEAGNFIEIPANLL
jgi:hypothetical protein